MSQEDGKKRAPKKEISIISSEISSIPSVEDLEALISKLDNEDMWGQIYDNGADGEIFYYPLLGFLGLLAGQFRDKLLDYLRSTNQMPEEITALLEHSYHWDKAVIRSYYQNNPPSSPQESLTKRLLEISLWLDYLRGRLSAIIFDYSILELLRSKGMHQNLDDLQKIREGMSNLTQVEFNVSQRSWVVENLSGFHHGPHFWNEAVFLDVVQWLQMLLRQEFHKGNPPYYIYIDGSDFPQLVPRIYRRTDWATGFGQRLVVPNLRSLTPAQKAEMWSDLLVEQDIYGNERIDHSVREEVFKLIQVTMPDAINHLDLCGGKGDFLLWLTNKGLDIQSQMIDISPKAVEYAKSLGLQARVGNVDEALIIEEPVDIITIIYAVQWLSEGSYELLLPLLKPGGLLIFNVYPPEPEEAQKYVGLLRSQGYVGVKFQEFEGLKSKHYIVQAQKPLLKE